MIGIGLHLYCFQNTKACSNIRFLQSLLIVARTKNYTSLVQKPLIMGRLVVYIVNVKQNGGVRMKKDTDKTLKELERSLSNMGSGLDAIDKTGSDSYYREHRKKSQQLIASLPEKIKKTLSSTEADMHNWHRLQKEIQNIRSKK